MEKLLRILCFSLLLIGNIPLQGQTFYNFEGKEDLQGWSIDKGSLSISSEKRKLGTHSLHIQGRPGGLVTVEKPYGLQKASRSQRIPPGRPARPPYPAESGPSRRSGPVSWKYSRYSRRSPPAGDFSETDPGAHPPACG